MTDPQRYHSMRDAYAAMYLKEDGEPQGPSGSMHYYRPFMAIAKPSVTKVNIDVTQKYVGPGETEKAYYTYPAGFDPTNREDITEPSANKKVEYSAEEVEISDEQFLSFCVESGVAADLDSAANMVEHMSDNWFSKLYEDAILVEKKKGRCWTGYKPTPGKKAFSPGSCEKA